MLRFFDWTLRAYQCSDFLLDLTMLINGGFRRSLSDVLVFPNLLIAFREHPAIHSAECCFLDILAIKMDDSKKMLSCCCSNIQVV